MDKQKQQYLILGVLLVVLGVVVVSNLKPKKKKSAPAAAAVAAEVAKIVAGEQPATPAVDSAPASSEDLDKQQQRAQLDWGVDPFFHTLNKQLTDSGFILKGVSVGRDKRNYALINDEIVGVGDVISGYEVMEVQRTKVLLKKGLETFYLTLPEE